jgi:hypothetical protein
MLKKLMKMLSVADAEIERITALPEAEQDALDIEKDIITPFRESQKTVLKNDSTFIGEIQRAEEGKWVGQFERKLKQTFDLTAEEVKDKKWNDLLPIAKAKATAGMTVTAQELQTEVVSLKNEIATLKDVEIPKIKSEVETDKKRFHIDNFLLTDLAGLEGQKKIIGTSKAAFAVVKANLSDYKLDMIDGKMSIKTKDDLDPLDSTKKKVLTYTDIRDGILDEAGMIRKSNGQEQEQQQKVIQQQNQDGLKKVNPHLDAANAHLQQLKDEAVKK